MNASVSAPKRGTARLGLKALAGALAALALAVPATALAHPGVYTVTPKKAPTGCVFPTTACLEDNAIQYAVANDGYAMGFTESNGITGVSGEGTAGLLNYKRMPGTWRAAMTAEQKRTYADAQTGLQAHATCSGVAALSNGANILAWQQRSDNDPFFNYIPWQKATAGLGDEPSKWIPVVKAATNVDLATLNTEDEFKAACTGLGGTYNKADTPSNINSAQVAAAAAEAKKPLEVELTAALGTNATLESKLAAWQKSSRQLRRQLVSARKVKTSQARTIKRLRQRLHRIAG